MGFIQQNAKQTKSKFREIERIIDTIPDFEINKSSTVLMSATDETRAKSIQFMKNALTRLIDVIPSVIHHGIDFDDTNIPKHWGFSPTHMKDIKGIISSHYTSQDVLQRPCYQGGIAACGASCARLESYVGKYALHGGNILR